MMKLSDNMMITMKNFYSINQSLVLRRGKIQRSMSSDKAVLVEAEFDDEIPNEFGIYDLNQFLGNITTMNSPDLSFTETSVKMNDGEVELVYYSCSPNLIVSPPDKELVMKKIDVEFSLTSKLLDKLLKLAMMNNFPNLSIIGKNGKLNANCHDIKNDTSNNLRTSLSLGDYNGSDFIATFKVENIKVISDDYNIEVTLAGFAKFTSKNRKLKYFIALESK
jgi:hypothetical protein